MLLGRDLQLLRMEGRMVLRVLGMVLIVRMVLMVWMMMVLRVLRVSSWKHCKI